MSGSFEQWMIEVMSGRERTLRARMLRAALAAAEPAYAGVASARNRRFDRNAAMVHTLPRPVISVGNLTTGGTGKTPAVQWLVRTLVERGQRPGILLRGYRKDAASHASSDEEQLLRESLGVPVVADADRVRGAAALLAAHPDVTTFVLDDGFQHRRVARDVDIVLIDATNPFGFDHVLPRGLLREPVSGIARADLVIITRSDQANAATLARIEMRVREHHMTVPVLHACHRLTSGLNAEGERPIGAFSGTRVYAVSGIGNPAAFERSLSDVGITVAGSRRFEDHHAYNESEIASIIAAAREVQAEQIFITEKDWVKLAPLEGVRKSPIPFVRAALRFEFRDGDEATAVQTIEARLTRGRA